MTVSARGRKIWGLLGLLWLAASATWAGDGRVSVQGAAASCGDGVAAIYVDCGNGTVTDLRTGLVWLADADCLGAAVDWETAMGFAAGLSDLPPSSAADGHDCGLSDGSRPGEWRLPSLQEWVTMVYDALVLDCDPRITSDTLAGGVCWTPACETAGNCSFVDIQSAPYWAATSVVSSADGFSSIDLVRAMRLDPCLPASGECCTIECQLAGITLPKDATARVWPVRGGQ